MESAYNLVDLSLVVDKHEETGADLVHVHGKVNPELDGDKFRLPNSELIPDKRYIPIKPEGEFIREKLYFSGRWKTTSKNFKRDKKPDIVTTVQEVQKSNDLVEWKELKKQGLVEKSADIKSYNPDTVEYQVDHEEDLSIRWNTKGFDSGDQTRFDQVNEDTNLRLVTKEYNLGKSRTPYNPYVGPNFTSTVFNSKAGSKTITGKPFLDKSGNPI